MKEYVPVRALSVCPLRDHPFRARSTAPLGGHGGQRPADGPHSRPAGGRHRGTARDA